MQDFATPSLYATLIAVIGYLFRLVLDRCYRAEKQVDTMLPQLQQQTQFLQANTEKTAALVVELRNLTDQLRDEKGRAGP